jgi:SNF2 family DNA or RNA helicase
MYLQMLKREFFHKGNVWEKHRKVMFVHGAMSLGQRQDIVDAFQQREGSKADLECDIIIGPVSLLGTGVNLTRARKIIILDIEWLATATQQAGFRIHRLGQLNETYIWILRCSKVEIDRKMHDVQAKRGALMDKASRTEEEAKRTKHEQQKEEEWDLEEGI